MTQIDDPFTSAQPAEGQNMSSSGGFNFPSVETYDEQVGGGRSKSPAPEQTPTRLRSTIVPTMRDGGVVRSAQARRAQLAVQTPSGNPEGSLTHMGTSATAPTSKPSINIPSALTDPFKRMGTPTKAKVPRVRFPTPLETDLLQDTAAKAQVPLQRARFPTPDNAQVHNRPASGETLRAVSPLPPYPQASMPLQPPSVTSISGAQSLLVEPLHPPSLPEEANRQRKTGLAPAATLDQLGFAPPEDLSEYQASTAAAQSVPSVPSSSTFQESHTSASTSALPTIPVTRVVPPTPAVKSPLFFDGEFDDHGNEGQYDDDTLSNASPRKLLGRLPQETRDTLVTGYLKLEEQLQQLAHTVAMPIDQVINLWHKHQLRNIQGFNQWNAYQQYHALHEQEELARLPPGTLKPDMPINQQIRSQCFQLFRDQQENYVELLRTHADIVKLSEASQTLSQHQRGFDKIIDKVSSLVSVFTIHEDAILGRTFATPNTSKFWEQCCRGDENSMLARIASLVYYTVTTNETNAAFTNNGSQEKLVPPSLNTRSSPSPPSSVPPSDTSDGAIKCGLAAKIEAQGGTMGPQRNLLWKKWPAALLEQCLILCNWPPDVPFPGDPPKSGPSKGISDLNIHDTTKLRMAIENQSSSGLYFERVTAEHADDIKHSLKPIFYEAPPDIDSRFSHGRRKFINGKVDRCGLAKKESNASTRVKQTPKEIQDTDMKMDSDHQNLIIIDDDDNVPIEVPSRKAKPRTKIYIDVSPSSDGDKQEQADSEVEYEEVHESHKRKAKPSGHTPKSRKRASARVVASESDSESEVGRVVKGKGKGKEKEKEKERRTTRKHRVIEKSPVVLSNSEESDTDVKAARPKARPLIQGSTEAQKRQSQIDVVLKPQHLAPVPPTTTTGPAPNQPAPLPLSAPGPPLAEVSRLPHNEHIQMRECVPSTVRYPDPAQPPYTQSNCQRPTSQNDYQCHITQSDYQHSTGQWSGNPAQNAPHKERLPSESQRMDAHPSTEQSGFFGESLPFNSRHAFSTEHHTDPRDARDVLEGPRFPNSTSQIDHHMLAEPVLRHNCDGSNNGVGAPSELPQYLSDGTQLNDRAYRDASRTRGHNTEGGSQQRAPNQLDGRLMDLRYSDNRFPSEPTHQLQPMPGAAPPSAYHGQALASQQYGYHDHPTGNSCRDHRQQIVYPTFDGVQEEIMHDNGQSSREVEMARRDAQQDVTYEPNGSGVYASMDRRHGEGSQSLVSYQPSTRRESPYSESTMSSTAYLGSSSSLTTDSQLHDNMAA
ncbi:hypothetical protein BJ138DRAFT_1118611 [Hygrophoropsis aurantiaca]|uniref:Uncharacterized protein n=1 Tax=Hygrophoropsis aurantiaca TaxID=72124 RepID=A0ACB7ZVN2_9AGAM|nr:hypothetical protein BJ138DRAFT_1118611 [Hygrophoropsis aurantiaca]